MAKKRELHILQLYPDKMNIYGDFGNVAILAKRARLYGYEPAIDSYNSAVDLPHLKQADIILGGGGQDSGQRAILGDLHKSKSEIVDRVAGGLPTLVICGLYQLFGNEFRTKDGDAMSGLGIFDAVTIGSNRRLIGNIVIETESVGELIGYENHSGLTTLNQVMPLGMVEKGYGNNGQDKTEGAVKYNAFGSYLHGPILSKNPRLADRLLELAVERKYGEKLRPANDEAARQLDLLDELTEKARRVAFNRPQ